MTNIDFYGGVDEIGGNKILVNDNKTSFFFDFGMSFSQANNYFSEFLQPRKGNGLLDFVEFGLLPKIKGIYREDYLRHCGLNCSEKPSVEGVLISHAHMDHSAYIHHLREDIPIYLTEESHLILKVLEETTQVSFIDMLHLKRDFQYAPKKRGDGYTRLRGDAAKVERETKIVKPYKTFEINDFKIKSAPVDHSLPGASAYLVESGDDAIVYTGDLRFHGRRPELTEKFVKEAKKFNPTVMISEGTRISEESSGTEFDIQTNACETINDFKGLVIVNFPVRDIDRLQTFYNIAHDTDRTLAVSLKQAYMLNLFSGNGYPELDDVAVYVPRKGWGLLGDKYYACFNDDWMCAAPLDPSYVRHDYQKWERDFLDLPNVITYKDLQEEPDQYIFRCDFFELKELIDIKPELGMYIRSVTEPFDEEMEIDYRKVQNWLEHFNLPMHQMHVSGHASGAEILDMIRKVGPEKVYPVHTQGKEAFEVLEDDGIKVVYAELS